MIDFSLSRQGWKLKTYDRESDIISFFRFLHIDTLKSQVLNSYGVK